MPERRTPSEDPEAIFDPLQDRHRGQYALRRLYHESERLMVVLYTAPSCGPCRSLKPIMSGVVDEFKGKIHYVEVGGASMTHTQAARVNGKC